MEGLGEDHEQDRPVAGAHRLEGPELTEILHDEQVESLPRDGRTDEKPEPHRDAEIDRNPGVAQIVANRLGEEVVA